MATVGATAGLLGVGSSFNGGGGGVSAPAPAFSCGAAPAGLGSGACGGCCGGVGSRCGFGAAAVLAEASGALAATAAVCSRSRADYEEESTTQGASGLRGATSRPAAPPLPRVERPAASRARAAVLEQGEVGEGVSTVWVCGGGEVGRRGRCEGAHQGYVGLSLTIYGLPVLQRA